MNIEDLDHGHSFGQEHRRPGETRTLIVIAITATMMVVEVAAGIVYGSMALLADGRFSPGPADLASLIDLIFLLDLVIAPFRPHIQLEKQVAQGSIW